MRLRDRVSWPFVTATVALGAVVLAGCAPSDTSADPVESPADTAAPDGADTNEEQGDEPIVSDEVSQEPTVAAESCTGDAFTVLDSGAEWFVGLTSEEVAAGDEICVIVSEDGAVADMFFSEDGTLGTYITGIYDWDPESSVEGIGLEPIV